MGKRLKCLIGVLDLGELGNEELGIIIIIFCY